MKTLFLIMVLSISAFAQCETGSVCISQETINKAALVADKLRVANEVIEKFQIERGASLAEREASQVLIKGLNELILTKDKIIIEYERINALYSKVIEFQNQIIENLEKRLNKPRTTWQKFLKVLKEVALVIAGIAIGRAGI